MVVPDGGWDLSVSWMSGDAASNGAALCPEGPAAAEILSTSASDLVRLSEDWLGKGGVGDTPGTEWKDWLYAP